MDDRFIRRVHRTLNALKIELPSWGFADTGTRFGKFHQAAAADTLEQRLHDAGVVHRLTGACPTVAVHVLWDFAPSEDPKAATRLAKRHGVRIGSINPNWFQDQQYRLGSFCSPDPDVREAAMRHMLDSIDIARRRLGFADRLACRRHQFPGQDDFVRRKYRLAEALKFAHDAMPDSMTLLIEYKPFEPAFYHSDIADWGMAYVLARKAGPRGARVLVDTGHHLPGCNIEHLVAFLLDEQMLGGFHFNDRKYADDDLTLGSIDPYAAFRIFNAIFQVEHDARRKAPIAYMIDQSHNLKPKLEAAVQTVMTAQSLAARASLVDRRALRRAQERGDIVAAEETLRTAFETDVRGVLADWRRVKGLAEDPLEALRESGMIARLGRERESERKARGASTEWSYA